jgi:T5SS/PEP-CTERM-associated repeat protein
MALGFQANTYGISQISGAGSAIKMTLANSMLHVGYSGRGELTASNGSLVEVRNLTLGFSNPATGVFNLSGVGSIARVALADSHVNVGRSGTGTINIQNGASFEASAGVLLGFNQGASGFVNVTGTGSQLSVLNGPNSNAYINIGNAGYGQLSVRDGGMANLRFVNIGAGASATGKMVVSGPGSLVTAQSVLNVGGHDGSGVMEITAGGRVESLNAVIGTASASVGQALISGSGSTWFNRGNLIVGSNGVGSLMVNDNARVVLESGQVVVSNRSSLSGSGGTIEGSVRNFGSLQPGTSPGSLIITGNYFHELGSVLEVEIGGTLPGEYDTLQVFGNVDLNGGMLDVSTWNSFQLDLAQEFQIMNIGGLRSGFFRDSNGSLLNEGSLVGNFNGVDLFITYGGSGVSLYTPAVPEPASVLLIGSAMGMSLLRRRRT